jgi:pimeloyl-ACP methyl ester carboxylesterase
VPVPLDRSGVLPGVISLSVERRLAHAGSQSASAVLALAGGPGQAALGLGEFAASALGPALTSRDLLVFDQRGTGLSHPLSCVALEGLASGSVAASLRSCALEIGPARGDYTTLESVADIESLREATGYDKLVLYGTSYGTKVALEYAERYPQHVEALVLDSVVPAGGPEPFAVPTFQAIAPALDELCTDGACADITRSPVGDVATLAARLRRRPLSGSVYDGSGHRLSATLDDADLLSTLEAGDLNPAVRGLLPAAVHSALHGDPDPLLRLHLLAQGAIPSFPRGGGEGPIESSDNVDEALFVTTSCEETRFPWQRAASTATRVQETLAALAALPASDFTPFDAPTALGHSLMPDCAQWPDASPPPPPPGPLPAVPTLILSGAQDLRTPTSTARSVAALIPGAQLLVVPFTGHSVLGSDFSECAEHAVSAFFAGARAQPCATTRDIFPPTPVTPPSLTAVRAPHALAGNAGRTLTATLDTLVDLERQRIGATLQADRELPPGASFGGLHGGYARFGRSTLVLRGLSLISGVRLSGTFPIKDGMVRGATIHVSGSAASMGEIRVGAGATVSGTLGGRHFDLSVKSVRLARVLQATLWPARPPTLPRPGLVERGITGVW